METFNMKETKLFVTVLLSYFILTQRAQGQLPVRRDGDIPQGAASLAFVFDITGSMYDDLVQVIEGAAKILATTKARREKPLYNYVLVPFHDPDVGPVVDTRNDLEFQRELRDLYVQGGGDCPEMSITAIQMALQVSLPNSFIYVFTDARSKDYEKTSEVLTLIQQKQSQVVFVMTGDCGNTSHPGYQAYEQIASTSSGQVFLLKKSEVNQVLNFVRVAVQSRKVNLFSSDRAESDTQDINLPIDTELQEFTISISGDNPEATIINPAGQVVSRRNGRKELLNIKNVLIINIKNPQPGLWRIKMSARGKHTTRLTGLSSTDFIHGFSKKPTNDLVLTKQRPISGIPTYLLLNATGMAPPGRFTQLELLDLRGNTLATYPVHQFPEKNWLYNVSAFIPPTSFFYLRVKGIDSKGFGLQRLTPTAISPEIPVAPYVYMPEVTKGHYKRISPITCYVTSEVPFSVQFYRDNVILGAPLYFSETANATWSVKDASAFSEGVYRCNATSIAGSGEAETYFDVTDPPPYVTASSNVTTIPGRNAILTCEASSTVEFNMTWYDSDRENLVALNPDKYIIHRNGSLQILNVRKTDEGPYVCRAANEGGHSEEKIYLIVQVAPVASVRPASQPFKTGQAVSIQCTSEGSPASYIWRRNQEVIPLSEKVNYDRVTGILSLKHLQPYDEGTYECLASNPAGSDTAVAILRYIEAPIVQVPRPVVLVSIKDSAKLSCDVHGIPKPNITWFKGGVQFHEFSFVEITDSGELMLLGVQEYDAGEYTCVATNEAGTARGQVTLEVGSQPKITRAPSSVGIDIETNGTLPCTASGYPPPKILWRREDGQPIDWNGRFKQMPSGSLFVQNIQATDEGVYVCSAQNQFGVQEVSAFVTVSGIVRPLIAFTNPLVEIIEGRPVRLTCFILLGNPKPKITWLKGDQVIQEGNGFRIDSEGSLHIESVRAVDEGDFKCHASNVGGNSTYITQLDVQVPPTIDKSYPEDYEVVQGNRIVLHCEVQGDPPPSLEWFKNEVRIPVTDSHYFISESGNLEIFSADPKDTASYSCSANNIAGQDQRSMKLFVQVPPMIMSEEDKLIKIVNNPVLLPCEVHAIPDATVRWYKDGGELSRLNQLIEIRREGLYIPSTQVDDAGLYECVASNVAGQATKRIKLTVQVPPKIITEGPTKFIVIKGDHIKMPCEATGDPDPMIMWRKNGKDLTVLDADDGYIVQESGALYIVKTKVKHTATYTCIAENPAGSDTRSVKLVVHDPPQIPEDTIKNASIIENQKAVLPCPASGTPLPRITWYKNGKEITGNELGVRILADGSLVFDRAEASDAGHYECIASNVAGNVSNVIEFKVFVPPRIGYGDGESTDGYPRIVVIINQTAILECLTHAIPPPRITWYKADVPLDIEKEPRLTVLDNGQKLRVAESQLDDTALYRCQAENVAGKTEKKIDLEVQEPPRIDETRVTSKNNTVIVNDTFEIDCPVIGTPTPLIVWFKDGEVLDPSKENIKVLLGGKKLRILSAEVKDTGDYQCRATNVAGETKRNYKLEVHVPPKIDDSDEVAVPEVVLNRTIVIICPASGIPIPEIAWFKDGDLITQNTSRWTILANGRQLEVRQAQVSDTGRFQCRAKNVAGESEKYFDLTVLVPPYIDKTNIIDKPKVVVNQTITISCPASGIPDPEIVWLKNGELLNYRNHPDIRSLSSGRQLEIRKAKVSDTAVYRCLVMNKAGEDFTDFTLQVLVPAYIGKRGVDEKPRIIVNNTFSLRCPAEGIPVPEITWLKDGFPIRLSEEPNVQVHENGLRLEILDSQVDDTGRYTCRAVNEAGDAEQDYDVQIWVPPTIDRSLIDPDPNVIVNNTVVIHCPAEGIPTPKITWLRNGQTFDTSYSEYYNILEGGLQLEISNAQVSDEAMYICIAENDAGRAHQEFELDVWVPPYFPQGTELSSSHKVIKDYTTVLHCPVMGHPEPTITWLKEQQTVEQTSRIHILNDGRQLEIMFAKESDTAGYACVAENVAGQAKKDFKLHVLVPPSIDRSNIVENPKVIINRTVILECPVKGIPRPEVEWLKNGRKLEQDDHVKILSDSRQIDIAHAQEKDTARYTCIASNEAGNLRQHYDLEVLVPPSVDDSKLLKKFSVIQNRTVFIECPAVGIPPPSILWLKNREPLLDFPYRYLDISSNGQRLQLRNAQVTDAATYTCIATNVAGQLERKFQLEVYVPPVIVDANKPPQKLNVVVERPISIECIAEGIPPPTIKWYKGGEEMNVDADPHITIHTKGRVLEITGAQVKDTASYTCRAENPAGMAERHYLLDVYVPPSINGSETLQQLTVTINRPIAIRCPATGIPSPKISWERENIPISPLGTPNIRIYEEGRRLQILSAQLREIGSYACVAVNPAGRATKNFNLDVQVPPTIEDGPTDVASIVDTRTTLQCESIGLPDPQVAWTKNGNALSFDTGAQLQYRMHKSGNLEFAAVKVVDEGEYMCTASNPAGQVSRRINLNVYVPPNIEQGKKEMKVLVGNTVILPCKATGTPKPIISWQKGAALQTNSMGFREILSNGSLKIDNARVSDSGMYICIAQNTAGTFLGQIRLEVLVPPFIEEQQTEFKVIQGHGLIMPCKSIGVPKPKIIWEKDGVMISPTDFSFRQIRSGGLAIPITKAQDSGTFTCIAENEAGRASVTMDLIVQVSPTITGDQRIFVVIQGETAMLPCSAEGIPHPQIQWMKDFTGLRDEEGKYKILPNGTLRIDNVKEQDQGSYVCRAENEAGKDSREILLRVQIGPSFTVIPQDQEVNTGGRIQLECEAVGMPTPVITWSVNGSYLPAAPSINGRSRLVIDNAMKDDDGTYTCEAENPAGKRKVVAAVRVKVPPKILLPPGNRAVTIAQRIILSCPVSGDPAPTIFWTKNGRPVQLNNRVQQLSNGSLIIYDSTTSDAGEYKCVATNDAGTSESSAFITIRKAPDFKVEPKDLKIDQGATLVWDCVAESEPVADITWKRETPFQTVLSTHDRITILQNNSLRIVATQLEDSALYTCLAKNPLGRALVQARLTVVVHGMFSNWAAWSDCSVSCGQGIMYRERSCDNPKPANGGRECVGETRESRRCLPRECAVDGSWSNWSQYESCSATCGVGFRQRSRRCDNPPPQFGGRSCFGDDTERVECSLRPCPVDGDWSSWSPWQPCSQTCGTGMQERYRDCNSPRAEHGGKECVGDETERRRCKVRECEIHGNWGGWAPWTVCSRSCNGGTKSRSRRCDSPAPSYGGRYCLGRDTETDYCNTQGCPIHGNWSPWGGWGDCTAECGGGYQKRFRTCGNPAPSNGGRACPGTSEESERCNEVECPVDGQWSQWNDWSKCTQTCGGGEQKRKRSCSQPRYGGKHCLGDETQIQKCNIKSCGGGLPTRATGNIIGNVNDIDFGVSTLIANITQSETGTIVTAKLHNIPNSIGRLMEHLISILTPVYWTTALEVGEAVNGYTLTRGEFRREVQVEFATGEILRMIHIARGMDSDGELQLDIVVNGYVPQLPPSAVITVEPYEEEYIQTAPGAIYAFSTRMFKIGNYILPYAWNHTITYDPELGKMPYLVQKLFADDLTVKFEPSEEIMRYQLSARIAKGTPSNKCPKGFFLDPEGPYCRDDDECVRLDPCSHYCHNSPGSFSCSCPLGFRLGPDGRTCKDIDECDLRIARCHRNQECVNTIGSYRCMVKCGPGFRRTSGGLSCQDINECRSAQDPCDQTCLNLIGSFRCRCKHGYKLLGRTKCIDVDECKQSNPCSHHCVNTPGSYQCSCPGGFELVIGGVCRDIDECAHGKHNCRPDEDCRNTQGSFQCVKSCPKGFEKADNGTCIDKDECALGLSRCHYNQKCINSYGGYTCTCPRGYRSDGPGKPCVDINECVGLKKPCTYQCRNIPGNFECICPPGMKQLADRKSCAGLEFLDRGEVLNVIGSPTPSNQYTPDAYSQSECQPGKPCALSGGSTLRVACPVGFRYDKEQERCVDYNECQQKGRCQHKCQNTEGSFRCLCPPGYKLSANKRTCIDIDECKLQTTTCDPKQICFNRRGDYTCIDTVCPDNYKRDPITGDCVLECSSSDQPCPTNSQYADILQVRTVSLPSGIPAYQDLIRLIAYNQYGVQLPNTYFDIIENDPKIPFQIRLTSDGKGVVYTIRPLERQATYRIKVRARSFDHTKRHLMYRTTFLIHIAVSAFPY